MKMNSPFNHQSGFGLIEVLVGLLIGLIGIIVMFQVLSVSEARKRSTAGSSELQISGSIAMYMLDRDIRAAGYGFANGVDDLNCSVEAYDAGRVPTNFNFRLVPVLIGQANGNAGPDTITVLAGNSNTLVSGKEFISSAANTKTMQAQKRFGFMRGDLVVAANDLASPGCALLEITDNTNADTVTLNHVDAGSNYISDYAADPVPARFNMPGGPAKGFTQGRIYDLGPRPQLTTWAVLNGALSYTNAFAASAAQTDVGTGVINMKAEYGIDSNDNRKLDDNEWTRATPTTTIGWQRLMAIRIAILVRGDYWDRENCSVAPQYTSGVSGAIVATDFVMRNVNGAADSFPACQPGVQPVPSADPNNWRNYRYRVYETIVPLKNMLWGAA